MTLIGRRGAQLAPEAPPLYLHKPTGQMLTQDEVMAIAEGRLLLPTPPPLPETTISANFSGGGMKLTVESSSVDHGTAMSTGLSAMARALHGSQASNGDSFFARPALESAGADEIIDAETLDVTPGDQPRVSVQPLSTENEIFAPQARPVRVRRTAAEATRSHPRATRIGVRAAETLLVAMLVTNVGHSVPRMIHHSFDKGASPVDTNPLQLFQDINQGAHLAVHGAHLVEAMVGK